MYISGFDVFTTLKHTNTTEIAFKCIVLVTRACIKWVFAYVKLQVVKRIVEKVFKGNLVWFRFPHREV